MINTIRIFPGSRQKFVVVRARRNGEEVIFLWGNPTLAWHAEIVEEMNAAGLEILEVIGGGWLYLSPADETLSVWGTSTRFGPVSIELVRDLLGDGVREGEPSV
jgi:hypothetical protein